MSTYVALLRGINVGGNNIIRMTALAETFARIRLTNVRTYIQSGNVLFGSDDTDARALERRIERAVKKAHGCDAKVVVRSREEMQALARGMPRSWKRPDPAWRYNVVFLRHGIDSKDVLDRLSPKPDIEEVVYRPGVLFWSARARDLTRTAMAKITQSPIYQDVTVRNRNTTLKLCDLLGRPE